MKNTIQINDIDTFNASSLDPSAIYIFQKSGKEYAIWIWKVLAENKFISQEEYANTLAKRIPETLDKEPTMFPKTKEQLLQLFETSAVLLYKNNSTYEAVGNYSATVKDFWDNVPKEVNWQKVVYVYNGALRVAEEHREGKFSNTLWSIVASQILTKAWEIKVDVFETVSPTVYLGWVKNEYKMAYYPSKQMYDETIAALKTIVTSDGTKRDEETLKKVLIFMIKPEPHIAEEIRQQIIAAFQTEENGLLSYEAYDLYPKFCAALKIVIENQKELAACLWSRVPLNWFSDSIHVMTTCGSQFDHKLFNWKYFPLSNVELRIIPDWKNTRNHISFLELQSAITSI